MRVTGLDHVNIRTRDVPGTIRFYADLLNLKPDMAMSGLPLDKACWLLDHDGQAVVHLFGDDNAVTGENGTGPIHHVALRCSGKPEMIERLQHLGVAFDVKQRTALTQIFVHDPNGILLELNFAGE